MYVRVFFVKAHFQHADLGHDRLETIYKHSLRVQEAVSLQGELEFVRTKVRTKAVSHECAHKSFCSVPYIRADAQEHVWTLCSLE
jgi:hypothetical protein